MLAWAIVRRPLRIVSLLPSATEIICALGLEAELVGVTHECDFPLTVQALPRVTETLIPTEASSADIDALVRDRLNETRALYRLNLPVLESLRPDLIVTQALCDVCAVAEAEVQAAACRLSSAPVVLNLEPQSLAGVFAAIRDVAAATGTGDRADAAIDGLQARVASVAGRARPDEPRPRVALLEWLDPPFSSGHWNPELVRLAGGIEVLGREGEKSRTVTWADVVSAAPDVILIACCGFTVERTRADLGLLAGVTGWDSIPAVRSGRVFVTDGSQYFSRPGPRLVDSLEILAHAIDPDRHPLRDRLGPLVLLEAVA